MIGKEPKETAVGLAADSLFEKPVILSGVFGAKNL
jgi:hypothetical protein